MLSNPIKSIWLDKATIIGTAEATDDRGFNDNADTTLYSDVPCKIVQKRLESGNQSFFDEVKFNVLLLIDNDITIPEGAKVIITDIRGHQSLYRQASGAVASYPTHQEIALARDDRA
jgi:hypothetical protein